MKSMACEVVKPNFCCYICVTLLWGLHIVTKRQFFLHLLSKHMKPKLCLLSAIVQCCHFAVIDNICRGRTSRNRGHHTTEGHWIIPVDGTEV